jgi:hypothetical protein
MINATDEGSPPSDQIQVPLDVPRRHLAPLAALSLDLLLAISFGIGSLILAYISPYFYIGAAISLPIISLYCWCLTAPTRLGLKLARIWKYTEALLQLAGLLVYLRFFSHEVTHTAVILIVLLLLDTSVDLYFSQIYQKYSEALDSQPTYARMMV